MKLSAESVLRLPRAKKIMVLAVILCAMGGCYFFLFFMPRNDELQMQKEELGKQMKTLNETKAITQDLERFKKQIARLDDEFKSALTQLPNEKEIPELLKNISSLGRESNLEFTLFRPKAEEPQQFYAKVPIELTVLGSYHDTGAFFDRVGTLPRIINVVDFNMSRREPKAKETEIVVRTSCVLNTYRFLERKSEDKKSEKKAAKK